MSMFIRHQSAVLVVALAAAAAAADVPSIEFDWAFSAWTDV